MRAHSLSHVHRDTDSDNDGAAATNKTIRVRPSRGGLTKKVSLREGGDLSHYCRGRWMHSSCAPCLIDQGFLSSETRLMQSSSTKDAHFWAGDHLTLTRHHRCLLGVRHEHATRSVLDKTLSQASGKTSRRRDRRLRRCATSSASSSSARYAPRKAEPAARGRTSASGAADF